MNHSSVEQFGLLYLERYAAKDMEAMEGMFDEQIVLRDWKIYVSGKKAALSETQKNFNAAESIEIDVLSTIVDNNTFAGELRITVDKHEVLYVVDVIEFTPDLKIKSIRAYLGRGND